MIKPPCFKCGAGPSRVCDPEARKSQLRAACGLSRCRARGRHSQRRGPGLRTHFSRTERGALPHRKPSGARPASSAGAGRLRVWPTARPHSPGGTLSRQPLLPRLAKHRMGLRLVSLRRTIRERCLGREADPTQRTASGSSRRPERLPPAEGAPVRRGFSAAGKRDCLTPHPPPEPGGPPSLERGRGEAGKETPRPRPLLPGARSAVGPAPGSALPAAQPQAQSCGRDL